MKDIEVKNAIIESAIITNDDHGLLSSWVQLDYGGIFQGFGGYALYLPENFKHHKDGKPFTGHWIWRVMEIAEVNEWSKLPGRTVRVQASLNGVIAIGHIVKDNWFNPKEEFRRWIGGNDDE